MTDDTTIPTVETDDVSIPAMGLGTWQLTDQTAYDAVRAALSVGFRHVDTAQLYDNEWAVGRAIADSDVPREAVFLTTKVDPTNTTREAIASSIEASLDRLGVDHVDLLLIHWPNPLASLETVMETLSAAQRAGQTRHIGVSNFGVDRLDRARALASVPVVTNQVLFHPFHPQRELLAYCQREGVTLTGYSPLAEGAALSDDLLANVGQAYDATPAQVALRWATQHENVLTIPRSTSRAHLAENRDSFGVTLSRGDHDHVTRPSVARTARLALGSRLRDALPG
ncbi:MAG: diketogulonate related aldo/keto reductase [halophilic archaeon J07HB67]|jgi:Aldo/keto reductases, related to diketogulonate reductase|nr:MAG: diketogulonate related aldo/keto reductase [halophilic archaeon J07HB67]